MKILTKIDFNKKLIKFLFVLIALMMAKGCTEPFDISNETIEDFLVVNATITDEVKNQKILLSRTIGFEENDNPIEETGATIIIKEDNTTEYVFNETAPGVYESIQPFGVITGKTYELFIEAKDQKRYQSEKVIAPASSSNVDIYAKRMVNDNGIDGVGIFLNSRDPSGNSKNYRFEFEETYKIVAPLWVSFDVTSEYSVSEDEVSFGVKPRPLSQQVCYKTILSSNINLVSTTNLTEDRIQDLLINFVPVDDIRVAERYSILVEQYVQTQAAQSFYNVLSNFTESDNIFSQIQPGFISGNIFSTSNSDENVVGFFDVSLLSAKRLFFNRSELIDDIPYEWDCKEFVPEQGDLDFDIFMQSVHGLIQGNTMRLLRPIPWIPVNPGEYPGGLTLVPRACGDCTRLGKSEIPDFWID